MRRPPRVAAGVRVRLLALLIAAGCSGCGSGQNPEALFAEAEDLRLAYEKDASHQALAKYRAALVAWTKTGRSREAARAGQGVGATYEQMGALEDSLRAYVDALRLSEMSADRLLESEIRSDLGVAQAAVADREDLLEEARRQCGTAYELALQHDGVREQARALNCAGEVDYHRGDSQNALASYRAAQLLWDKVGDDRGRAETLLFLGYAHTDLNQLTSARPHLQKALSLWT